MMRLLNILVIVVLVAAAADVYKIKFAAIAQVQRLTRLRMEIRREQEAIAALRAEWAKLDSPARLQALAQRHLPLRPLDPRQFDSLDNLPQRPPPLQRRDEPNAIGMVRADPARGERGATGSIASQKR